MTAEMTQARQGSDLSTPLAAGAVAAPALFALWLGVRDQGSLWAAQRAVGLILVLAVVRWFVRHDRACDGVSKTARIFAPVLATSATAFLLPWSPTISAAASAAAAALSGLLLTRLLYPAAAHRVSAALTIACTVLMAAGAMATATIVTPPGDPEPRRCKAAGELGVPERVATEIERAHAREGGEAGCLLTALESTSRGTHIVVTLGGYWVLGWENHPLPGLDGAPNAAVVWSAAFTSEERLMLLDEYRPSDRLYCADETSGFVLLVDDDGLVRSIIGTDDFRQWNLVPEALIGSYVTMAQETGTLPVPTGRAETTGDLVTQQVDIDEQLASTTQDETKAVQWFLDRCN